MTPQTALQTKLFPPLGAALLESWTPPPQFAAAAKFARLDVDVEKLCEIAARDKRLALPGPSRFSLPLCLVYPEQGSLLFETATTKRDDAIGALNNVILRLLATRLRAGSTSPSLIRSASARTSPA